MSAASHGAAYPPRGLLLWLFRAPLALYRVGLGGIFGSLLVLIDHVGRTSGKPYRTLVECVERDKRTGDVTVVAGYGERTQWYRNLRARPETTIQVGNRKIPVRAEFLSPDEGVDVLVRVARRRGRLLMRALFGAIGYGWDGTEEDMRRIAREALRFVRFHPVA